MRRIHLRQTEERQVRLGRVARPQPVARTRRVGAKSQFLAGAVDIAGLSDQAKLALTPLTARLLQSNP